MLIREVFYKGFIKEWVLGTGDYSQIVTKRESDYIQSLLYATSLYLPEMQAIKKMPKKQLTHRRLTKKVPPQNLGPHP